MLRRLDCGFRGWRRRGALADQDSVSVWEDEKVLEMMEEMLLNNVNVADVTELDTQRRLL